MLTNILVASPSEAAAVAESSSHKGKWSCIELKGLDNAKLAALCSALGALDEAKALEGERYLLDVPSKSGPWVFQLPQQLRDALTALSPEELNGVAERWVSNEELRYDGWAASDVVPLIQALQQLASDAVATKKELLLWMAL